MGIVRFKKNGAAALGVRIGEEVVDLSATAPSLPSDIAELLRSGTDAVPRALALAQSSKTRMPLAGLQLLPPAMTCGKILCLGLNYHDHAAEGGKTAPDYPMVFMRSATTFSGHEQPIVRPKVSQELDWEGELVAFIGKPARHVSESKALDHIAGYSVFNDASIRDYQRKTQQWTVGKNFDSTGGFGPELVPADKLPPGASGLKLQTRINGQVMQDANTSDMIFNVARTVAILSECMTLEPGDLLVMGTPAGVGWARKPSIFMKPGDICEIEIEGIGLLRNPIVQEE